MGPHEFVEALRGVQFEHVFNPYSDRCDVYDLPDAPAVRTTAVLRILSAAANAKIDAIWIGRDLGYRGGRRTGLALTDDVHLLMHAQRWSVPVDRATTGDMVAERTAAVIWGVLEQLSQPVFLWNVFPFHPHPAEDQFSNRSHSRRERDTGEALLAELVTMMHPTRLVAIGNDAAVSARRVAGHVELIHARHPSYGGQRDFVQQMHSLYDLPLRTRQPILL